MRRVLLALVSTVTGLVLLLSFKTHPAAVATSAAARATKAHHPTSSGAAPGATATAGRSSKTVTGAAADTTYGPVQVQITVTGGAVTAVNAIEYPQNSSRDVEINSYAIPQLDQEATAAKSASIDFVSGATYTSQGYVQSLQSALDQAGL